MHWIPTRQAALDRLEAFLPRAGAAYAAQRNFDHGPQDRTNISGLSPYIRRRMITEEEVVAAVLQQHSFAAAEKFIQEVAWRTYWKGWLEMRPAMLHRFDQDRIALRAAMGNDRALDRRHERAIAGETDIACFDAWVEELRRYGWLHNHSRMWFASIWIFTLGLPWQLGADFFYKNLLDADPASNTLSWRWVAGLHTQGKHYLARADNIERCTVGRFAPYGALNENAAPLYEDAAPVPIAPIVPAARHDGAPAALLLTEEDLHPESWDFAGDVRAVAVLPSATVHPPDSPAALFSHGALLDAAERAAAHFGVAAEFVHTADLPQWAAALGVKSLLTGAMPTGMVARAMQPVRAALGAQDIRLVEIRRPWDDLLWPRATAGFFKLKTALPKVIGQLGL